MITPNFQNAQEREMTRIPITIEGDVKTLSPGGHNVLISKIVSEFAARFTPAGKMSYTCHASGLVSRNCRSHSVNQISN